MKKQRTLSKKETKALNGLLATPTTDWMELKWDSYNQELIKAFTIGRKYQKEIENDKKKKET